MTKASANRTGIRYVEESTWGTTPATPTLTELRYTGEGVNFDIETTTSNEIRSDRMTSDLVQTNQSTGGNIDFELSFDAFDDFIEAAMFNEFGSAVGINGEVTISFDNASSEIRDSANGFGNVVVGQWVYVSGASNSGNNGYFRVTAVDGGGADITVDGTLTDEAASASVTITGQRLINGVTAKFFSLEKTFNDTTVPTYQYFTGVYVNGMSLSFETGSILTGSFDLLGKGSSVTTTRIASPTDQAASTNDVMNAVNNVSAVEIDNVAFDCSIQSMSVDMTNNLRQQNAIGELAACGIGLGRFELTGDISLYFEDETELNKYINNTSFQMSFRVQDGSGNAYVFTMPNCEYESMNVNASGLDTDVILEGSYRALLGAVGGVNQMLAIDRLPVSSADVA